MEEGIEALFDIAGYFFARDVDHIENPEEELRKWKTQYDEIHNRLFVLTHIARIKYQIFSEAPGRHFRLTRYKWQPKARMTKTKIKRDQLQALREVLEIISAEDFDHSKHQFNSLSDLKKINIEESTDTDEYTANTFSSTFSKGFSKSVSKSVSKGGYESNPF